jgi:hypothetical protein
LTAIYECLIKHPRNYDEGHDTLFKFQLLLYHAYYEIESSGIRNGVNTTNTNIIYKDYIQKVWIIYLHKNIEQTLAFRLHFDFTRKWICSGQTRMRADKREFAWEFRQDINSRMPSQTRTRVAWKLTGYYRSNEAKTLVPYRRASFSWQA